MSIGVVRRLVSMEMMRAAALFTIIALLTVIVPDIANAQCSTAGNPSCSGTFLNGYYDTSEPLVENGTGVGDNFLRLNNPTRANGNLCAMIYVFDDDQHMGECCGCPLSPDKLLSLSVEKNLTANFVGRDNDSGVIDIISALPDQPNPRFCFASRGCNGGCDPTQTTMVPTRALKGYMVHNQAAAAQANIGTALNVGLTEVPLADAGDADPKEFAFLTSLCGSIVGNGSGAAVCNCGPSTGGFAHVR